MSNHLALKRIWRIRNAWLAKAKGKRGDCHKEHVASRRVGKRFKNGTYFPALVVDAQSLIKRHALLTL